MDGPDLLVPFLALAAITLACLASLFFLLSFIRKPLKLNRISRNPVLRPRSENWWESEAVFNPAAFVLDGRVHILCRALGRDGVSRIGYASSPDGIHFDERSAVP